jgi:hypothetical protein
MDDKPDTRNAELDVVKNHFGGPGWGNSEQVESDQFDQDYQEALAEPITKGDLISAAEQQAADLAEQEEFEEEEEGFDPFQAVDEKVDQLYENQELIDAIRNHEFETERRAEAQDAQLRDAYAEAVRQTAEEIAAQHGIQESARVEHIAKYAEEMATKDAEQLLAEGFSESEILNAYPQLIENAMHGMSKTMKSQAVQDGVMRRVFGGRAQNVDWNKVDLNTGAPGSWNRVKRAMENG